MQIRHLERGYAARENYTVSIGIPDLDNCFDNNGLSLGRVHEVVSQTGYCLRDAAPLGFVVALLVRIISKTDKNKKILWCSNKKKLLNSRLSAAGLHWLGLDPHLVVQAKVVSDIDQYWVMEEGLKCPELTAVVIELTDTGSYSYTQTSVAWRRLQLASEIGGVTGFVLRSNIVRTSEFNSIPESRWRITSLPSNDWRPKWKLEILRSRSGKKSSSIVIWDPATGSFESTTLNESDK